MSLLLPKQNLILALLRSAHSKVLLHSCKVVPWLARNASGTVQNRKPTRFRLQGEESVSSGRKKPGMHPRDQNLQQKRYFMLFCLCCLTLSWLYIWFLVQLRWLNLECFCMSSRTERNISRLILFWVKWRLGHTLGQRISIRASLLIL